MSQAGTATNAYQFAGEQLDSTFGDYYLRQRFYDTSSGRFGRMDTYSGDILEPLSFNKYLYAHSNPVIGTDPSGYFRITEATETLLLLEQLSASSVAVSTTAPSVLQAA